MAYSPGSQPPPYRPPTENEAYELHKNSGSAYVSSTAPATIYNARGNGNGSYYPEIRNRGAGVLDDSPGTSRSTWGCSLALPAYIELSLSNK